MRIGIDIDGVLTDCIQFQLDYGSKFAYQHYHTLVKEPYAYETMDAFGWSEEQEEEFVEEFEEIYATKCPARLFAGEVMSKLKEKNEIYIITARRYTEEDTPRGEWMRGAVKQWLEEYKIPYDKLVFSEEDKVANCMKYNIDIMIEDKIENIENISKRIPVICYDAEQNRKCEGENIIRAYSWYDILGKIEEIGR